MQTSLTFNEKLGFMKQTRGFSTKAIHTGVEPEQWKSRAVVPPIVTSTTFARSYDPANPNAHSNYQYSRYGNPTREVLDKTLAALDNGEYALTLSAGVAALTAILQSLEKGDGIISTRNLYGGTLRLFRDLASKMSIDVDYVDFDDLKSLENSFKANTKMVWMESPTNPLLTVLDIKAIADIVHAKSKAFLVVDNTFLTSYLQRPLDLGADVAMYSLSKFTNGHTDCVMGAIVTNNKQLYEGFKYFQISTGLVPSPYDCYMVTRSLKTLSLRMEKHSENSFAVATYLESHEKIEKVFHPSLKSHKNHEVALKQSYGHSGIMSFYIKGSFEQTKTFYGSLKLILISESLGGVESNAAFPWMMSHADMSEELRLAAGVTQNLIRLSVGLEDVGELIEDLKQALETF